MPKYAPAGDEMDSSYGAPVTSPEAGEESAAKAKPSVDEENAMSDTALVPTKILSPEGEPLNEGDEIVVQVVSVHGDQAIIKYAPKKKEGGGEGEGSTESETTPGNEESEIASLDQKGY